jgi:hypothetical protein
MTPFRSRSCRAGAAVAFAAAAAVVVAGCDVGSGTELGPQLPLAPAFSSKAVVLDDDGRGVSAAVVEVGDRRVVTGANGRGDLQADLRGRRLVRVDGAAAAASDGDRLGSYAVALTVGDADLPESLHLPDLRVGATVAFGAQAAATAVETAAGDRLTIGAGTFVAVGAANTTIDVRLGVLQAVHLPGDLPQPAAPGTAHAWSRGVLVAPADVAFTPAAELSAPDELGVGGTSAAAALFRLDAATGEWTAVATAVVAAGGRLTATGAIAQGGLYAFAVAGPAGAVSGTVVDAGAPTAAPLAGALVRVDQRKTTTDAQGRFRVDGVAVATPGGAARTAAIEAFAGGAFAPARAAASAPLVASETVVPALVLDTRTAADFLVQQLRRGRATAFRGLRLSTLRGDFATATTFDADGVAVIEDVPTGFLGLLDSVPLDAARVQTTQVTRFVRSARWDAAYSFLNDRNWDAGGRNTSVFACDEVGGGPLERAFVVEGDTPAQGLLGETRESGAIVSDRNFGGRVTVSRSNQVGGDLVVHARSIVDPYSDRVEAPLQVVRRSRVGAFDRHGLVGGALVGADPTRGHALRATRRIAAQEWWDEVVEGLAVASPLPVDVDPAVAGDRFLAGVPASGGNLAVAQFAEAAGAPAAPRTLARFGFAADVTPTQGARLDRDLPLAHVADATFPVPSAFAGAPAEVDPAALRLALALQRPSGAVVDVARGLTGNHARVGDDLVFTLPPLAGDLAGSSWLALLDGRFPGPAGTTLRTTSLVSLPRGSGPATYPRGDFRFRPFPTVSFPTTGAVVPASGFTAFFALPAGAMHAIVELRNVAPDPDPDPTTSETLRWSVFAPPSAGGFAFVALPNGVATPLRAGRDYELTVAACYGDGSAVGPAPDYYAASAFLQSIGALERGVSHVAAVSVRFRAE